MRALVKHANKEETYSLFCLCCCFFVLHVSPGGLKITCEYITQHEGVLCEEVMLLSETNDDVCVRVKVHARVMGKVVFNNIYVII